MNAYLDRIHIALQHFLVAKQQGDAQDGRMSKPETNTSIPKTDIPRTEIPRSALPHEAWVQAARDNLVRYQTAVNAYWDEIASFENAMYERARAASADLAGPAAEPSARDAAL
jgi:hypothetical protein